MNPLITIFNGRRRRPGDDEAQIYAQVDVTFRQHLHRFKGARLSVFMCIALHIDKDGWTRSLSIDQICHETGYTRNTVAKATAWLRQATLHGYRVLLVTNSGRDENGTWHTNEYLVFPTDQDIRQYETQQAELPLQLTEYQKVVHGDRVPINGIPLSGTPKSGTHSIGITSFREKEGPEEDLKSATTLWERALSELRTQMTKATFDTWLSYTQPIELNDHILTIATHTIYAQEWLENRLRPHIERTVNAIAGEPVKIRFTVKGENADAD